MKNRGLMKIRQSNQILNINFPRIISKLNLWNFIIIRYSTHKNINNIRIIFLLKLT